MNKQDKVLRVIVTLVVFFLAAIAINFLFSKILPENDVRINQSQVEQIKKEVKKEIEEEESRKVSKYPDFTIIQGFKKHTLITDFESYAPEPDNIVGRFQKTINASGEFSRMYILIKASVDHGKPLSVYDDVWITFNFRGGHILPDKSLPTPSSNSSQLLYSASRLPYRSSHTSFEERGLNVLEIFSSSSSVRIDAFLSSAREGGKIGEISLYYECAHESKCDIFDN